MTDSMEAALDAVRKMLNIPEPPKDQHRSKAWNKNQYVTVSRLGILAARKVEDKK